MFHLGLVWSQSYVYRTQKAVDYANNDIGYGSINLESCLSWCTLTTNCIGVAYNPENNADCWIKYQFPNYAIDPENPPAPGSFPVRDTIIKISNTTILNYDYQVQPSTSYSGNLLITFLNQPYTYCIAQCDIYAGAGCVLVLMDSAQNRCYLISGISSPISQTGFTAYLQTPKSLIFTTSITTTLVQITSTTTAIKTATNQLQTTSPALKILTSSVLSYLLSSVLIDTATFTNSSTNKNTGTAAVLSSTTALKTISNPSNLAALFIDSPLFIYAIIAVVVAILVLFIILAVRSTKKQKKFIEKSKVGEFQVF